jgi:ferrous iron transport protein B
VTEPDPTAKKKRTDRLDNILLHRVGGYIILLSVLFLLFQSVFWMASFPMDGIEWIFTNITTYLKPSVARSLVAGFVGQWICCRHWVVL